MSNNKQSILEEKEHLDWSKLTQEQKDEIIKLLADGVIKIHKKVHEEMIYDIFTPFWVKWWRKLIRKNHDTDNQRG